MDRVRVYLPSVRDEKSFGVMEVLARGMIPVLESVATPDSALKWITSYLMPWAGRRRSRISEFFVPIIIGFMRLSVSD